MGVLPFRLSWPAWYWLSFSCFLIFVILTWAVLAQGPQPFDDECAAYFKGHAAAHPWVRNIFWALTQVGSGIVLGCFAGAAISLLLWRRERLLPAVWLLAVIGGALLNEGLKGRFDRSRPEESMRDVSVARLTSLSYPSGHAMGSTVGLGLFAFLVLRRVPRKVVRRLAVSSLIVLILLVGFSRIYLRAHWCSDVLGGFAIGAAWLIFCVAIYERLARRFTARLAPDTADEPEEMAEIG